MSYRPPPVIRSRFSVALSDYARLLLENNYWLLQLNTTLTCKKLENHWALFLPYFFPIWTMQSVMNVLGSRANLSMLYILLRQCPIFLPGCPIIHYGDTDTYVLTMTMSNSPKDPLKIQSKIH